MIPNLINIPQMSNSEMLQNDYLRKLNNWQNLSNFIDYKKMF